MCGEKAMSITVVSGARKRSCRWCFVWLDVRNTVEVVKGVSEGRDGGQSMKDTR